MRIIVAGASGLLGCSLVPRLLSSGYEVFTLGRSNNMDLCLDASERTILHEALTSINPDIIINLIAITDVDFCEHNPTLAFRINVQTTENIVKWVKTKSTSCHLIHIASDHVYDNFGEQSEDDVLIRNYYAFSKYASELVALNTRSTILRTNFFGKSYCKNRNSFSDWIFMNLKNGSSFQVFSDVLFSPLNMETLISVIEKIMNEKPIGIFNAGSKYGMSKAEFALLFAKFVGYHNHSISMCSINDFKNLNACRPKNMVMSSCKLERALSINMPSLEKEIYKAAGEYDE